MQRPVENCLQSLCKIYRDSTKYLNKCNTSVLIMMWLGGLVSKSVTFMIIKLADWLRYTFPTTCGKIIISYSKVFVNIGCTFTYLWKFYALLQSLYEPLAASHDRGGGVLIYFRHSVRIFWMSDRPVAKAFIYIGKHNTERRGQTFVL
jgi:hypothetical protein